MKKVLRVGKIQKSKDCFHNPLSGQHDQTVHGNSSSLPAGKLSRQRHWWEAEYRRRRQQAWMAHATKHNMTYDEYVVACDRKAADLVSGAAIWVRVRSSLLLQILSGGRFKTIFDTPLRIGTKFSVEERAVAEERLFGYPKELTPEKRPVYAYLTNDPNGIDFDWRLEGYGYVALHLKDELKELATYTFEDTMSSTYGGTQPYVCPRPLKAPSADAFNCSDHPNWDMHEVFDPLLISSIEEGMQKKYFRYVEVQIHGDVNFSDIQEIIFPGEPLEEIRCMLEETGIPYRIEVRKYPMTWEDKVERGRTKYG